MAWLRSGLLKDKSYPPRNVPNNLVVSKTCQFKYPVSPSLCPVHYTGLLLGSQREMKHGLGYRPKGVEVRVLPY